MDKQKIFPTAMMGFEKSAVLDYIYEQDTLNKNREKELLQQIEELKQQLQDQQSAVNEDIIEPITEDEMVEATDSDRMFELEDAVVVLHDSYDDIKVKYESVLLENEALQKELNEKSEQIEDMTAEIQSLRERTLQQRLQNEHLVSKLENYQKDILEDSSSKALATGVTSGTYTSQKDSEVKSYEVTVRPKRDYNDIKEEINEFKSSVTDTLLGFETALARLAAVDSNLEPNNHTTSKRYIGQLGNNKN